MRVGAAIGARSSSRTSSGKTIMYGEVSRMGSVELTSELNDETYVGQVNPMGQGRAHVAPGNLVNRALTTSSADSGARGGTNWAGPQRRAPPISGSAPSGKSFARSFLRLSRLQAGMLFCRPTARSCRGMRMSATSLTRRALS